MLVLMLYAISLHVFSIQVTYCSQQETIPANKANCPISSSIERGVNGSPLHNYPFELYSPEEIASNKRPEDLVPCNIQGHKYNCTSSLLHCPLNDENIRSALQYDEYGFDFCDFDDALRNSRGGSSTSSTNKRGINLIIFGGSVTKGFRADYPVPCPLSLVDNISSVQRDPFAKFVNKQSNGLCSLVMTIFHYLSQHLADLGARNGVNVTTHYFAASGTHTGWAMQHIDELFASAGIGALQSSDLVFVDYSFNDGALFLNGDSSNSLIGLEGLVSSILSYKTSDTTTGIPRIILTDHYPKPNPPQPSPNDYRDLLIAIARQYNCSLWSPRSMLQNAWANGQHSPLFKWSLNQMTIELHPYFFSHLLIADLYSRILEVVTSFCSSGRKSSTTSAAAAESVLLATKTGSMLKARYASKTSAADVVVVVVPWKMPELLSVRAHLCDKLDAKGAAAASSSPLLLEAHAGPHMKFLQSITTSSNSSNSSSQTHLYSVEGGQTPVFVSPQPLITPAGTWKLYEDRPGRPGWIMHLGGRCDESKGGSIVFSANEMVSPLWTERFKTSSPAGSLNTAGAAAAATTSGDNTSKSSKALLRVEYLRTYEHAGTARVELICGDTIIGNSFYLDALWLGNHQRHLSLTHLVIIDVTRDIVNCNQSAVSVNITSPAFKGSEYTPSLSKLHNPLTGIDERKAFEHTKSKHRGDCKFKVIGVTLCRSSSPS